MMPADSRLSRGARALVWFIRVLAVFEVADSLVYLGLEGWFSANPILVALVGAGIVGALLTWVRSPLLLIGLGGLMVAVAPAIFYPLSYVLAICSLVVVAIPVVRVVRRKDRGTQQTTRA